MPIHDPPPGKITDPLGKQPSDVRIPVSKQEEECLYVYAACHELTGQVFADQTGKFVVPSTAGHNYVMVLYNRDSNAILSQAMKSRNAQEHVKAYKTLHTVLVKRGLRPKLQQLNIECSNLLREFFEYDSVDFQLTPAGDHRRNTAKRAIHT